MINYDSLFQHSTAILVTFCLRTFLFFLKFCVKSKSYKQIETEGGSNGQKTTTCIFSPYTNVIHDLLLLFTKDSSEAKWVLCSGNDFFFHQLYLLSQQGTRIRAKFFFFFQELIKKSLWSNFGFSLLCAECCVFIWFLSTKSVSHSKSQEKIFQENCFYDHTTKFKNACHHWLSWVYIVFYHIPMRVA